MNLASALLCSSLSLVACGEAQGPPPASDASLADMTPTDAAADSDAAGDVPADTHPTHDASLVDVERDASVRDVPAAPRTTREANGCAPGSGALVDLTNDSAPTIVSGPEYVFTPACARVRVGQRVTFRLAPELDWATHTLSPGEVRDNEVLADPTSPIPLMEFGDAPVVVTFAEPGTYPYVCTRHWLTGHLGAIQVVP